MRKTKICIWMGTRQRSTSRLSRVMGLAGVSGYAYWIGLPAAPLMGLRRVTLKYNGFYVPIIESQNTYNGLVCATKQVVHVSPITIQIPINFLYFVEI